MTTNTSEIDEIKSTPWNGGRSPFNVEYGKMMMWFFLLSDATEEAIHHHVTNKHDEKNREATRTGIVVAF